jgi:Tol biopolymer transport system component
MTTRPRTAQTLCALMLAAAACTGDPDPPTAAEGPAETPAVAWGSDAERTIYLWDPTTGHGEALFTAPVERGARLDDAEQSPDGTRVVFERQMSDLPPQIYLLEADGTERRLTDLAGGAFDPTWSPDGTTVAFSGSQVEGSDLDIYAVDLAGGTERRIAGTPKDDGHPDWSPDGAQIVFDSRSGDRRSGTGAIWVASARTDELHRLTPRRTRFAATVPAWSPDGRWIAYRAYLEGATLNGWPWTARLWLMRPDGSGKRRIGGHSEDRLVMHAPSWSPDGRTIVTQRTNWRPDTYQVLLFDPRTREVHRILKSIDGDAEPSWGADGILLTLWSDDPVPTEPAPPRFRVRA